MIFDALISTLGVTRVAPILKFPFCVVLQKISRKGPQTQFLFHFVEDQHVTIVQKLKFHKLGCGIVVMQNNHKGLALLLY